MRGGRIQHIVIGAVVVIMAGGVIVVNALLDDANKRDVIDRIQLAGAFSTWVQSQTEDVTLVGWADAIVQLRDQRDGLSDAEHAAMSALFLNLQKRAVSVPPETVIASEGPVLTQGEAMVARVLVSLGETKSVQQMIEVLRNGVTSIGAESYFVKAYEAIRRERE